MKNIFETKENIILYHTNFIKAYEFQTDSWGFITERTFDKYGYTLSYKSSTGSTYLYTRDEYGNELAFKNLNDYWEIKNKTVTQQEYEVFIYILQNSAKESVKEYTMEELVSKMGHNFKIKK